MTVFNYISENIDRIRTDVKIGLTSYCVIKHWAIYSRYLYYRGVNNSVSNSVLYASSDFKISDRTLYKIIKKMEATV
jgi:hypothetical protein